MVEFTIAAPVLLLMGLGSLQFGLIYHGKTTLNYATFEAARAGATRHAEPDPMRRELGLRLAPLFGGDGAESKAAGAIARSIVEVDSVMGLDGSAKPPAKLEILNPTAQAFEAWAVPSLETEGRTAIPNSHLEHQGRSAKAGVTLQDANLLKIKVTYPFELKIPFVAAPLMKALALIDDDPEHDAYYASNRLPLESVATVRMQSEVWGESLETAGAAPYGGTAEEPVEPLAVAPPGGEDTADDDEVAEAGGEGGECSSQDGLPPSSSVPASGAGGQCPSGTWAPSDPLVGGAEELPSSPVC